MAGIKITIVVAVSENGVIGNDGDMPWKLSTDLKRFKALTLGKPLIMGRKTFESIGRPLPGRPHVIVSRNPDFHPDGIEVAPSLEAAIDRAAAIAGGLGVDEIFVVGGGDIYRQALPLADTLHVTHVEAELAGDTRFPSVDPRVFEKIEESPVPAGEKDTYATRYAIYRRRPAA
ncbi:MAG TPA: diacylglycerol kinase [Rhizobium sp.]|nr:diacylglycerol kinase [Rhizobium sp.]